MQNNLKIFIDGACQPNPGSGGVGIHIIFNDIEEKISSPLSGVVTNNIAEYEALILSLETILKKKNCLTKSIFFLTLNSFACNSIKNGSAKRQHLLYF